MSINRHNEQPAFPVSIPGCGDNGWSGMTLRDYFAAQALPAIIAGYLEAHGRVLGTDHILSNTSVIAYKFADAMIEQR